MLGTASSIKIAHRVAKSDGKGHELKYVNAISPEETCVLAIGGSSADDPELVSGYAKYIRKDLKESSPLAEIGADIEVYSVQYLHDNVDDKEYAEGLKISRNELLRELGRNPQSSSKYQEPKTESPFDESYIKELFERVMEKRISSPDGKKRLSFEEACHRVRKMPIVAHCHGAYIAIRLEEMMQKKMKELGYSDKEAFIIQKQQLVLAISPNCPVGASKSKFISFCSASDVLGLPQGNLFSNKLEERMGEEQQKFENDFLGIPNNHRSLDLSFVYMEKDDVFLVKNIYEFEDYEGPYFPHSREHDFVSRDKRDIRTKDGELITMVRREILGNWLRYALDNQAISLPKTRDLVIQHDKTSRMQELFDTAAKNGDTFCKSLTREIREDVKKQNRTAIIANFARKKRGR